MKLKLFAFLLLVVLAVLAFSQRERIGAFFNPDERPNIVLIYTDDIDCEQVFFDWNQKPDENGKVKEVTFPTLKAMADEGISFTNFHVTTPVCGPSRACLFSGNYAHRNGFRVNDPTAADACGFSGGFDEFDQKNEMGHWMQATGYRTAFVGKYLHHGFEPAEDEWWNDLRPMGWDQCIAHLSAKYYSSFWTDFETFKTESETTFRTDREVEHCQLVWQNHASRAVRKPLFLCWAPLAAHNPFHDRPMVAPRHLDWEIEEGPTQESRFREIASDESGHPCMASPNLSATEIENLTLQWRKRMKAVKALDEGLAKLRAKLKASGELKNTIFIFTSDHGFSHGAHRHIGKRFPYDRVTKVPFLVCGPGVPKGKTCDALLANIDIAPTMVGLTGNTPPANIDGRDFAELFSNPNAKLDLKRDGILIENWEIENSRGKKYRAAYTSLRTQKHIYTEWAAGKRDYYDLGSDPDQLNNLFSGLDESKKNKLWDQLRASHALEIDPIISNMINVATREPVKHGFIELSGYVEDDNGIEKVEVIVHEKNNDVFWNGKTWQNNTASAPAIVHSSRGIISEWSFAFGPDEEASKLETKELDLTFSVGATDLQGNTTWKQDVHQLECSPDEPEAWIDLPVAQNTFTQKSVLIEGRAVDNQEIKEVRLTLRDMGANKYWNGLEWSDEGFQIKVPLEPAPDDQIPNGKNVVKFSYNIDCEITTQVFVAALAYDNNGKFDQTIASRSLWHPSLDKKKDDVGEEENGSTKDGVEEGLGESGPEPNSEVTESDEN